MSSAGSRRSSGSLGLGASTKGNKYVPSRRQTACWDRDDDEGCEAAFSIAALFRLVDPDPDPDAGCWMLMLMSSAMTCAKTVPSRAMMQNASRDGLQP
eukprot:1964726-Rhodomonas_salina.1